MKTVSKIKWIFTNPAPELQCIFCGRLADYIAHITGDDVPLLNLPVCPDCGQMEEAELLRKTTEKEGKNEIGTMGG